MGYLDPNLFGILSQIGFGILFGVTTAILFFPKLIAGFARRMVKLFSTKSDTQLKAEDPQS